MATLAGMAFWPATALAGSTATGGWVQQGPVLAGSEAVWVVAPEGYSRSVRIAPPSGPARTLWTTPHPESCEFIEDLTASPGYVAFLYSRSTRDGGGQCGVRGRRQLVVLRTDGTTVAIDDPHPDAEGEQCMPIGVSLDGVLLAVQIWNCYLEPARITNLTTGAVEDPQLPQNTMGYIQRGFTLAGRYIAYHEPGSGNPGRIVVFDREAHEEVYSVPLLPFIATDQGWPVEFAGRLALQPDGALAATVSRRSSSDTAQLIIASPEEPDARVLRTDIAAPGDSYGELAMADGRIAVRRSGPKDYVLIDPADGTVAATFDRYEPDPCNPLGWGLDWDGTRLAWVNEGIRNELHPATPSTPGPPIDPYTCPSPNDGGAPPPPATTTDPVTPAAPGPLAHISSAGTPRTPATRCRVPKLKGRNLRAAKKLLKAQHCRLGKVKRRGRGASVVIAHSPKAGARRPAGTRVKLTLGRRR